MVSMFLFHISMAKKMLLFLDVSNAFDFNTWGCYQIDKKIRQVSETSRNLSSYFVMELRRKQKKYKVFQQYYDKLIEMYIQLRRPLFSTNLNPKAPTTKCHKLNLPDKILAYFIYIKRRHLSSNHRWLCI